MMGMAAGLRERARQVADGQGYFLILLVLSVMSFFFIPAPVILRPPFTWAGILFIAAGLLLAMRCRALFLHHRTTMSPYESPAVLITGGPFRFSRNPAYLSMMMVLFGSAVLMGTVLPFVFTALFIAVIEVLFIPYEERRLAESFGDEYREYRDRVRRWI